MAAPDARLDAIAFSFKLTFWSDVASAALCAALVVVLRAQRAAALDGRGGSGGSRSVLQVMPIYEPVLWFLGLVFALQALFLGVPGPYPQLPPWFLGATDSVDAGAGIEGIGNSALYWCYW